MAHRKPLGTTCKIHFANDTWDLMPTIDDYLVSDAGTAYRVVGLEEGRTRINYVCERVAAPAQPSFVYEFYWLRRSRLPLDTDSLLCFTR